MSTAPVGSLVENEVDAYVAGTIVAGADLKKLAEGLAPILYKAIFDVAINKQKPRKQIVIVNHIINITHVLDNKNKIHDRATYVRDTITVQSNEA